MTHPLCKDRPGRRTRDPVDLQVGMSLQCVSPGGCRCLPIRYMTLAVCHHAGALGAELCLEIKSVFERALQTLVSGAASHLPFSTVAAR